jgi:hypothetical protein
MWGYSTVPNKFLCLLSTAVFCVCHSTSSTALKAESPGENTASSTTNTKFFPQEELKMMMRRSFVPTTLRRLSSGGSTSKALMPKPDPGKLKTLPKSLVNPWKPVKDKKSGMVYYWNQETSETTAVGARKPEHWIELPDPSGNSALTYWWNPETQETTALGVPRPTGQRALAAPVYGGSILTNTQPPMTFGKMIMQGAAIGFAFSFSFLIIRVLFG